MRRNEWRTLNKKSIRTISFHDVYVIIEKQKNNIEAYFLLDELNVFCSSFFNDVLPGKNESMGINSIVLRVIFKEYTDFRYKINDEEKNTDTIFFIIIDEAENKNKNFRIIYGDSLNSIQDDDIFLEFNYNKIEISYCYNFKGKFDNLIDFYSNK